MILTAIRLISKATTVVVVAKTGYSVYKKGTTAYKTYKKVKGVGSSAKTIAREVKKVINKK